MTVFKSFWKVVSKYKGTIILYTVMLIVFGGLNMSSNNTDITFTNSKPDILIINKDEEKGLTKNLINYMKDNSNIIDVKLDEDSINDALFYRDVNYVIYIPENYRESVLNKNNPEINIKSSGDYQASLANMLLSRYIQVQKIYLDSSKNEEELINNINNSLNKKSKIEIVSKLDTSKIEKSSAYFNFASYSIMAIIIFIICLVLSSFKNIKKRTIISSMNYKKYNQKLLVASIGYSLIVWLLFIILGIIILGNIMFSLQGLIYCLNALIFTFVCLTLALLIGTIIDNKNAISGIVNVIALGQAFLCGAFVPAEWLPKSVLNIAHILPAYWYINTNDLLKTIEIINIKNLQPILINSLVLILFSILFIIINNVISKYRQKIG